MFFEDNFPRAGQRGLLSGGIFLRRSQGRMFFEDNFPRAGQRGVLSGGIFLRVE